MSARPFATYPKDREALLKYAATVGENFETESMAALEMAALVEAILTDEEWSDEVKGLAALVAERDALRKALQTIASFRIVNPEILHGMAIMKIANDALARSSDASQRGGAPIITRGISENGVG